MLKITTLFSAAVVVALSVSMTSTANAAPWTFTSQGTISSGYDTTGVFGSTNTDLTGKTFTQSITLDPTAYIDYAYSDVYINESYGSLGSSATATDTVTVDGVTQTFTWDLFQSNLGRSYLAAFLTNAAPTFDEVYQYQTGSTADDTFLTANNRLYSYVNAFDLGLNFDQSLLYNVQSGDVGYAYFNLSGHSGIAHFEAFSPSSFVINAPAVPEPETYAMLLLGLGLLGFIARRSKSLAA